MKALFYAPWAAGVLWGIAFFAAQPSPSFAQTVTPQAATNDIRIESAVGRVEVNRGGNTQWLPVLPGQGLKAGDRVRTLERSRVSIRWSDQRLARLPELSDVQISATGTTQRTGFSLITGFLYFFSRERLTNARYGTQSASAAIRGTEFVLQAEANGRTTLTVVEGEVELSNEVGSVTLRTSDQGVAEPGQQPRKTATIIVNNVIQWALYYPAVLDVDELGLTLAERNRLVTSLAAYKSGELLRALDLLPAAAAAESSAEKIYRAGLLLAVGNVAEAEQVLSTVAQTAGAATGAPRSVRLADALRTLIAAVKLEPSNTNSSPELASEWLAASYAHQSHGDLRNALQAARKSVEISADFGFGWTRVAELEFSFGHTGQAHEALERGLLYSPRNAQALALKGFVLAAQNRISEAISWFNRAITVDANLANAWLGRGLCLIRQGHSQRGREDLLTAAAMEPQRAILRSYLGKAYTDAGDEKRARHELQIAKDIDQKDPTAWLYSALLNEQENRINDAVRDLEKSQELTGNRYIYRSGLQLDQDRAVRSANLARIYQDAGMFDVAVREASRAVAYDYANYSAHLFLANSYDSLRDPNRINLRYETPAEAEYLIANLLAPVGAGILSQTVSQQEYSKLFERDRFGIVSSTEFLSRGAVTEHGAQYGTFGNTSYALEAFYRTDPGQRPNNDFEEREILLTLKAQLTAQDSIFAQAIFYEASGGDLIQRYDSGASLRAEPVLDPTLPPPGLRFEEHADPTLHFGYHREWRPGMHTLILGSRLDTRVSTEDLLRPSFFINRTNGQLHVIEPITLNTRHRTALEIYSAELQQIWQQPEYSVVVGGRYQDGDVQTTSLQTHPIDSTFTDFFDPDNPAAIQDINTDFERLSVYGYHHWEPLEPLALVAGISYDWLRFPRNFRAPPISAEQDERDQLSPKAGAIWHMAKDTVARAAYTRSLGGISVDQSARIEPTQVAGFNQAFRSVQPEAFGGSLIGARFTTYDLSVEKRFPTRTYIGLSAQRLESEESSPLGAFQARIASPGYPPFLSSVTEELEFCEQSILLTLDQLVGEEWAFGARYRLANADIDIFYPNVAPTGPRRSFRPQQNLESTLHRVTMHTIYNHSSGLFAQGEATWYSQNNSGFDNTRPGDDFWQVNLFAGVRLWGRNAEFSIGVLNLFDQDYRLEPLTLYNDLPRERTLVTRLHLNF